MFLPPSKPPVGVLKPSLLPTLTEDAELLLFNPQNFTYVWDSICFLHNCILTAILPSLSCIINLFPSTGSLWLVKRLSFLFLKTKPKSTTNKQVLSTTSLKLLFLFCSPLYYNSPKEKPSINCLRFLTSSFWNIYIPIRHSPLTCTQIPLENCKHQGHLTLNSQLESFLYCSPILDTLAFAMIQASRTISISGSSCPSSLPPSLA